MPKMTGGIDVGGAGSDKKFRRESMARLNEFSRELRTFREVDMAGTPFSNLMLNYAPLIRNPAEGIWVLFTK